MRSTQEHRRSALAENIEPTLTDLERANQRALTAECLDRHQRRTYLITTIPTHTMQTIQGSPFPAQAQQTLQGPGIPPLFGRNLDGHLKRLENAEDDNPSHRSDPQSGPHSRSRPPQDSRNPSLFVRPRDLAFSAQAQQPYTQAQQKPATRHPDNVQPTPRGPTS